MKDPCNRCQRRGLPLLAVAYAALPTDAATEMPALGAAFGDGVVDKKLQHSTYVLRGLEPGYVYLLCGRAWRGYLIDAAGYPRYYPDLTIEDMPSAIPPESHVRQCARQGKNHTGIEALCIEAPELIQGPVYIAYSRHRWTRAVRVQVAKAPAHHMQQVARLDGSSFAHAVPATAENLQKWVIDFNRAAVAGANRCLSEESQLCDRSGTADALAQAMLASSGALQTPGVIMALHDPVGITVALNQRRSRLAAQAAELAGVGDEGRARRRVIADVIEGLLLNAEARPGPWYDRHYGRDRFERHIDLAEWRSALQESQALKALQATIKTASADYVQWKESPAWKRVQAQLFDAVDDASAAAHERMVAASVAGSGLTQVERDQVWGAVLRLPATSHDHWLFRALAALHADLWAYVAADKKEDKEYDAVKNATALAKLWSDDGKKLAQFHAQVYARRRAGEATAALIESTSAMLFRLSQDDPAGFHKLVRAIATALITRADVAPQPVGVRGTASRVAAFIHQAPGGGATVPGQAPVVLKPLAGRPGARKGNFGPKAWELAEVAGAEVVFKAPNTVEETRTTVAWVLRRLNSGAQLNEKLLKSLSLAEVDLTVPQPTLNPFLETRLTRLGAQADMGLAAGAVFFQVYSFRNALQTFSKPGPANQLDGGVGMLTAVLSASAGLVELGAAVLALRANKATAARLMRVAGVLSLGAGLIEGGHLAYRSKAKKDAGDMDSAWWTLGTGATVALGGIASAGAAIASASVQVGGGGMMLGLGPVVWTLLAIALLSAGLYCGWQAWATDDSNLLPVEYWLDNGTFGKRQFTAGEAARNSPYVQSDGATPPFHSLQEEVGALQRVLLVAQARLTIAKDAHGFGIMCFYDVAVPRYEAGTRLEIAFTAVDGGRRLEAGLIVCEGPEARPLLAKIDPRLTGRREGPTLKHDPDAGTMRLQGYFSTMQGPTVINNAFERMGWHKDVNLYADTFEMHVTYWPDKPNIPVPQPVVKALAS